MTTPLTDPLIPHAVYTPANSSSSVKVIGVSIQKELSPSSRTVATMCPGDAEPLDSLLEERSANSEASVNKTKSIFNRFFSCCKR